ncbi:GntR family transcriptional regulator [Aquabacter spiritensis]|uniref:GntR family transcriptional regulator n=1 Tax=Aquabacter spiritensis TaxID=933073 RepID=A0A4R3M5N1_9HYPH|nr:GntR family transcriptional regulator [Aquabacter spiritensis]TCT06777.1 GntR family transcriptional regulator [Aquabacter spiritensis]
MPSLVRTEPLYDQIYEILWEKILALEIVAGTRLRDVEWAEKLEVSRTPVREALRKLQKDGVLEPVGHGRYVLKRISPTELRALYRCRAVLEALAVRDLAGHLKPRELAALAALVEKTQTALDAQDFRSAFQFNTEFHQRLTTASGNTYLLLLLENIRRLILFARSTLRTLIEQSDSLSGMYAEHLGRSQSYHLAIVAALEAGDYDGAARAMEQHLFNTAEDMSTIFERATQPVPAAAGA